MSSKKLSGTFVLSAFVAMTALSAAVSCGGDGGDPETKPDGGSTSGGTAGTTGGGTTGGGSGPYDMDLTLVGVLDLKPVAAVHKVELLSAVTGLPLDPKAETMTADGAGTFSFKKVARDPGVWIHVIGAGPKTTTTSTYDSLSLSAPDSGDKLIRISTVGTASIAEKSGKFTADQTKIAIGGAVYQVDGTGKRIGSVGCAQVFLDDSTTPAAEGADDFATRYVASTGLPAPLGTASPALNKTLAGAAGGKFFIGNVPKGKHTFKVSMDGGKTFIKEAEKEIYIPFTRDEAAGDFKGFLTLIGLDVPGKDPTPAGCPTE